jgi:CRP/FNR family transcriptional regulator, cyclic AMP receptor protein
MNIDEFIHHLHPFLSDMTPAHLRLLAENATEAHFAAGDLIFREGANADRFYLIQRGEVDLQTHSSGKPVTIQTIHGGDVLGWSWLFPPYRWHFDARAQRDTDAIFIYAPRLRERIESDPVLGYEVMKRVAKVVVHRLHATRLKFVQTQTVLPHPDLPHRE